VEEEFLRGPLLVHRWRRKPLIHRPAGGPQDQWIGFQLHSGLGNPELIDHAEVL